MYCRCFIVAVALLIYAPTLCWNRERAKNENKANQQNKNETHTLTWHIRQLATRKRTKVKQKVCEREKKSKTDEQHLDAMRKCCIIEW